MNNIILEDPSVEIPMRSYSTKHRVKGKNSFRKKERSVGPKQRENPVVHNLIIKLNNKTIMQKNDFKELKEILKDYKADIGNQQEDLKTVIEKFMEMAIHMEQIIGENVDRQHTANNSVNKSDENSKILGYQLINN